MPLGQRARSRETPSNSRPRASPPRSPSSSSDARRSRTVACVPCSKTSASIRLLYATRTSGHTTHSKLPRRASGPVRAQRWPTYYRGLRQVRHGSPVRTRSSRCCDRPFKRFIKVFRGDFHSEIIQNGRSVIQYLITRLASSIPRRDHVPAAGLVPVAGLVPIAPISFAVSWTEAGRSRDTSPIRPLRDTAEFGQTQIKCAAIYDRSANCFY
jgi:hypothetical protein